MELFTGYDPTLDLDRFEGSGTSFLLTVHDDGTHEVAVRPGWERRDLIWSPPITLQREPAEATR
jgi:hypothetical protein